MSTSTISFSQAPPITSMEPAFRLRMRGDLLGRPGPSEGWGEVCNARSGSSDAFLGHRFSMLPWSVFISSFYATTGTGDILMAPRLPISDFPTFYLTVLFPSFPTTWFLNPPVPIPSTLTHLRRGRTESIASWCTAFFLDTFHSRAEVQLHVESFL